MNHNPNFLYLQDRPDNYGGTYSHEEIDTFIKQSAKKGRTKVVDFSNHGKKYDVEKEMKRITGAKHSGAKHSGAKKPKKTKKQKQKKLSRSARMSLRRKRRRSRSS
jgi:hypothetical protein